MVKSIGNKVLAFLCVVFPIIIYLLFNYEIGFMITTLVISAAYFLMLVFNCKILAKFNDKIFCLILWSELLYLLEASGCKHSFLISIFLLLLKINVEQGTVPCSTIDKIIRPNREVNHDRKIL